MMSPSKQDAFREGTRLGRYVLRQPIGAGGHGQVMLAWQENATGRPLPCVVKLPLQEHVMSDQKCQRLLDEAGLAIRMGSHPNIVQVIDADVHDGLPFIVMEYVKGADLGQILRRYREGGEPMPLPCVYEILASAAEGLHYAHVEAAEAGKPIEIVHRDITPGNILITRDGGTKLADFGLGRTLAEGTAGEHLRGTFRYMSPEHISAKVTPEMDVYGLGAVAWEMVENRVYRDGVKGTEHFPKIMAGEIPPMRNTAVPQQLRDAIEACLQAAPRLRPSASELVKLLRRCPGYTRGPDAVRHMMTVLLGDYRPSGTTGAVAAATPQLAATLAVVNAMKATRPSDRPPSGTHKRQVGRGEAMTPQVVSPPVDQTEPGTPRAFRQPEQRDSEPKSVTLMLEGSLGSTPSVHGGASPRERTEVVPRPDLDSSTEAVAPTDNQPSPPPVPVPVPGSAPPVPGPVEPRRGHPHRFGTAITLFVLLVLSVTAGALLVYDFDSDDAGAPGVSTEALSEAAVTDPRSAAEAPVDDKPLAVAAVSPATMPDLGSAPVVETSDDAEQASPPMEPAQDETTQTERPSPEPPPAEPKAAPIPPTAKKKAKTKRPRPQPKADPTLATLLLRVESADTIAFKVGKRTLHVAGKAKIHVARGRTPMQWQHPTQGWRSLGAPRLSESTTYRVTITAQRRATFSEL